MGTSHIRHVSGKRTRGRGAEELELAKDGHKAEKNDKEGGHRDRGHGPEEVGKKVEARISSL